MEIQAEPLGDLAIVNQLIQETGLIERIEDFFPTHHLWQGPGVGKTLLGLLMYILSENDHRLSIVESWASTRQESLKWLLNEPGFEANQLSDDRLGNLLDLLGKDEEQWSKFQRVHNEALLRLYDIGLGEDPAGILTARIDSTTVQSHRDEEGLFQSGYNALGSDLPQLKMMLLALDKANLPLAMYPVAGHHTDDKLYIPTLELAWRQGLPTQNILIVGDAKLCTDANMVFIEQSQNYYLGPLAQRQLSLDQLDEACQWIEQQQDGAQTIVRLAAGAKQDTPIALARELPPRLVDHHNGQQHEQRLIAVCTIASRDKQLLDLEERLAKAQAQVQERFVRLRGRKTLHLITQAQLAIDRILDKFQVKDLFQVQIHEPVSKDQGCRVSLEVDQQAYQKQRRRAGWRILATNAPLRVLSAQNAVLCYWEEYRIEQQFHLLLCKCTALRPIYLKKEKRILAMINILMLALQLSNLWQYRLRLNLAQQPQQYLTQVVPSNPGMKVYRPTTQLILRAFKDIQIIFIRLPNQSNTSQVHVQGLKENLLYLLHLLNLPDDIYDHPFCRTT